MIYTLITIIACIIPFALMSRSVSGLNTQPRDKKGRWVKEEKPVIWVNDIREKNGLGRYQ